MTLEMKIALGLVIFGIVVVVFIALGFVVMNYLHKKYPIRGRNKACAARSHKYYYETREGMSRFTPHPSNVPFCD